MQKWAWPKVWSIYFLQHSLITVLVRYHYCVVVEYIDRYMCFEFEEKKAHFIFRTTKGQWRPDRGSEGQAPSDYFWWVPNQAKGRQVLEWRNIFMFDNSF